MKLLALFLFSLFPVSTPSGIVFKVEAKDRVQSYLPVHFRLERTDGAAVDLKQVDVMKCTADGQMFMVCDGIEYKIAGVTFEVEGK